MIEVPKLMNEQAVRLRLIADIAKIDDPGVFQVDQLDMIEWLSKNPLKECDYTQSPAYIFDHGIDWSGSTFWTKLCMKVHKGLSSQAILDS